MKNINWTTVLLLLVVGWLGYNEFVKKPNDASPSKPGVAVAYSATTKAAADGLAGFPKQADAISAFYRDFAKVMTATDKVKTTGQFREAHRAALQIFVAADEYKGAPLVGDKIDAALSDAAGGLEDGDLTPKKAALVARLQELSAAFDAVK